MNRLEQLKSYCEFGWRIFPVFSTGDGKGARITGWQELATNDFNQVKKWHYENPKYNWGVITGSLEKIIVVDHDKYKNPKTIIKIPETLRAKTGRGGLHYYYKYYGAFLESIPTNDFCVEVKADNGSAILPPSQNLETGNYYEWENWGQELAEFPISFYRQLKAEIEKNSPKNIRVGELPEKVIEGGRNDTLFRLGSSLRAKGLGESAIQAALLAENKERCNPPLDEGEVIRIAESCSRYEQGEIYSHEVYHLTDLGNAKSFVEIHRGMLIYSDKSWYIWDGKVWKRDTTGKIYQLAEDVIRLLHKEASEATDSEARKQLGNHATHSESAYSIKQMVSLAENYLSVDSSEFDKDKELLNVKNGIVNLRTGELLHHDSKYLMRKIIKYDYIPGAKCEKWLAFLSFTQKNDFETIRWLQKALGLSISGRSDRVLPFLYGSGGNGKSVFCETLLKLFNDYGQKTNIDAFSVSDFREAGDKPNSHVARLKNARLVIANETKENGKLNVALIKDLTGADTISTRDLHSRAEQFSPIHTIWIYGNHKPRIDDTTDSIWDRICEIPFTEKIPEDNRKPLDEVVSEFLSEGEGILAWIIEGYQLWLKEGLKKTKVIEEATDEFRDEEDIFRQFINEEMEMGRGFSMEKDELIREFNNYCFKNGEKKSTLTKSKITRRLKEMGIEDFGKGRKQLRGIRKNIQADEGVSISLEALINNNVGYSLPV